MVFLKPAISKPCSDRGHPRHAPAFGRGVNLKEPIVPISEPTEVFFNKRVINYDPDEPIDPSDDVVYRLAVEDESQTMAELIEEFLARVDKCQLEALIIGKWIAPYETSADEAIASLVAHAAQLPNLRAIFIGDMTFEESEISWIIQGSYKPLLDAYPCLEELRIRGATELVIEPFTHAALRRFTIESGGLPAEVAEALAASSMPNLRHLELWLGTSDYGFSGDVALYRRVVAQLRTPCLDYLGLRDSEIADELAQWLAGEAFIAHLDTLDLSLGTLGDIGAQALYASPHVPDLRVLNLSHHYITEEWQDKLRELPVVVLLDDPREEIDGQRYVAVGE